MTEVASESVEFFATPGYGDRQLANMHHNQAVRIGNRVETSGQGGWNDDLELPDSLADEIVAAFDNLGRTLATAGATWRDVVHVNSYHVVSEQEPFAAHNEVVIAEMRHRMPDRAPIWTATGVAALGGPQMRVEIRVTAVVGAPE